MVQLAEEDFDLTYIALKCLVFIPNAGAPRHSWTKGKKRSCDRYWVRRGGRGLRAEKRESASEVGSPADPSPKWNHVTLWPVEYDQDTVESYGPCSIHH